MNFLNQYYNNILIFNLINKFEYKTVKNLPLLKAIILNFGCNSCNFKTIATAMAALEFISGKKGMFTKPKNNSIFFKVRKGGFVGCKIVLKKNFMFLFLIKLIFEILPRIKFINYYVNINNNQKISLNISEIFTFFEFEKNYKLFNNLNNLQIVFLTNTKSHNQLLYVLSSLKIVIKNN